MATKKITELPIVTTLNDGDLFEVVASAISSAILRENLFAAIGGSAQLLEWTFIAGGGAPSPGQFSTNSASASSTITISLHKTPTNGSGMSDAAFLRLAIGQPVLCFTDSTGRVQTFNITAYSDQTSYANLTVVDYGTNGNWSGNYTVSLWASGIISDTGWTANADAGDKTVVINSTASLTGIQTVLNVVGAGVGDAFFNLAQKVKAIEAALAVNLLPNA